MLPSECVSPSSWFRFRFACRSIRRRCFELFLEGAIREQEDTIQTKRVSIMNLPIVYVLKVRFFHVFLPVTGLLAGTCPTSLTIFAGFPNDPNHLLTRIHSRFSQS